MSPADPYGPLPGISDSHAHLTERAIPGELYGIVERAKRAGLTMIVNIGSGYGREGREEVLRLHREFPFLIPTAGIHPHEAKKGGSEGVMELKSFIRENIGEIWAVGEAGLDFHYGSDSAAVQEEVFRGCISCAEEFGLPLIIHMRESCEEVFRILSETDAWGLKVIFHCFSGDAEFAKKVLKKGAFISIAGPVTFRNDRKVREVARMVPPSRLLLETDTPFLAPEPFRGKRNEPANIVWIAQKVAELKGLTPEDVARVSAFNLKKVLQGGVDEEKDTLLYRIRDSLYLNITNRCTLSCTFCPKRDDYMVMGYTLKLKREPGPEEILKALERYDLSGFREVVFCGFGEPTMRLDLLKRVTSFLKKRGVRVRLDTDGLANLVHKRNILPELKGLVDSISISLNAGSGEEYSKICPSKFGEAAFVEAQKFILEAKKHIPKVVATAVALPQINIERVRRLVERDLGVPFRLRKYNFVG